MYVHVNFFLFKEFQQDSGHYVIIFWTFGTTVSYVQRNDEMSREIQVGFGCFCGQIGYSNFVRQSSSNTQAHSLKLLMINSHKIYLEP
jgi:hypothetical protein